jgi:hypothetical protein
MRFGVIPGGGGVTVTNAVLVDLTVFTIEDESLAYT